MMKKLILVSLLLSTQLFAAGAHAALFDDAEARKKILEVEAVMQSQNQASQATLAKLLQSQQALEQRVLAIEAITKGQVLGDMLNQIETLKQDVAKLKGQLEFASHNVDTTQQRQKDLYTDTDARLRKLESSPAPSPASAVEASSPAEVIAATPSKNTQEFQLLELANGLSKESKFKDAFSAYDK
ncbi:MAG: tol-pal system protein, partial [Methylophilales bacterium]|nr:tol-pal system protein [Methylophilales bacterium]